MKLLIGYVSMSGNTEDIANLIRHTWQDAGHAVSICDDWESLRIEQLSEYDGVILGTYTWGDGDLPYEAEDFVYDLEEAALDGLPCAAFGSGDTDYPKYCAAVDTVEEALQSGGGHILTSSLKIEFDPNTDEKKETCMTFAKTFLQQLEALKKVQPHG
ncbi:flavodoxin [Exiguobacterium qingdaonense]|uniref:flavodoxin n=1 Tax=Exiguobacterium qingdaonense TaxID=2751251 RepID=UPI001BE617A8|nr:flavodoxin [Exiguobacterium qingdaonense]